ncbi:hypothetical protein VTL71DRAFT_3812 [Oculimacula yallundae]|uniref:Uncharacterized protein n=1 Tax=Oculimacula yallundae TaxID=86028 RepID=A0ABR4C441_9HELO
MCWHDRISSFASDENDQPDGKSSQCQWFEHNNCPTNGRSIYAMRKTDLSTGGGAGGNMNDRISSFWCNWGVVNRVGSGTTSDIEASNGNETMPDTKTTRDDTV